MMTTKEIKFDYNGGEYTQNFNIRGTNLPWTYECDCPWLYITTASSSLTFKVDKTYDFQTRTATIKVFDKFRNEIDLIVEQTGYYDLSIECPTSVVLYETYYDENETYDVYVSVYGGPTQEVGCKKITPYLNKVWDNSDMYNDFILRIPKSLSGDFNIKHSDWKKFKDFCKASDMDYPKDNMEKKLSIIQISKEDVVGEMVLECNGETFTNKSEQVTLEVTSSNTLEIKVVSAEFVTIKSRTEYEVNKSRDVKITSSPVWLDTTIIGNKIILKCNEFNSFNDRLGAVVIENVNNVGQYAKIMIKQKSGT